jgi:hypothetical protein
MRTARKIGRSATLAFLSLFLCGQSRPDDVATGGPGPPPLSEGAYRFECANMRAEIQWRQERFDPDRVPALIDALRVTPLALSTSGESVPAADLARLRALFGDFAWIEQVWGSCDGDQALLSLHVMPLRDWIAYIEERAAERPRLRLWSIRLSSTGIVSIE